MAGMSRTSNMSEPSTGSKNVSKDRGGIIDTTSGLPAVPAAACWWKTPGKRHIFQVKLPELARALKAMKGMRHYLRSYTGTYLYAASTDCTARKARAVVRSLTAALARIPQAKIPSKFHAGCVELTGREGGEGDPNWISPSEIRGSKLTW